MRPAFSPLLQRSLSQLSHGSFFNADQQQLLTTAPSTTSRALFQSTITTNNIVSIADNIDNDAMSHLPSALDILLSPDTVLPPINAASEPWVRSLVWFDFKVAVAFFVVAPLILLLWAIVVRFPPNDTNIDNGNMNADKSSPSIAETILRYMTSYWQASSLLLLTLTLDIQGDSICVVVGLLAQAMIVASLWWWEDLNDELLLLENKSPMGAGVAVVVDSSEDWNNENEDISIGKAFVLWRYVATLAASTGVIIQVPFQTCVVSPSGALVDSSWCAPWLEPPTFAASQIGITASPTLGILTWCGLGLYVVVLAYYVGVLIPSVGRGGRSPRPGIMNAISPIGAWQMMGFLDGQTNTTNE